MCGICGIVSEDASRPGDARLIEAMANALRHRGPDDSGYHVGSGIALGHRRLSIIDIKSGHQPIYNEDNTKCIVFNGEIYNYQTLRAELLAKGHRFSTFSDTEVILHLYEELGLDCVKPLRGMFAFAIWDKADSSLFVARDRLGIKPLYYMADRGMLRFASEIKAILASGPASRELNLPSVDQYLQLNYTIGPETIFAGIKKLMPGQILLFKNGKSTVSQYWDFNEIEETKDSFEQCLEALGSLIEECVQTHLVSEVPLGAFLSGGVDSSVTVAIMTRLTGKPVKTFTVGYEDADDVSELEYARIVAEKYKSEHHEFILRPKKFMEIVEKVLWHLDEPVAEFATIPLLLLSELAKKHVTVMLSGEGADELFGGYQVYRYMNAIERYRQIPGTLRKYCIDPVAGFLLRGRREGKYVEWLKQPLEQRYLGNGSYLNETMRKKLYSAGFKNALENNKVHDLVGSYYEKVTGKDTLSKMLYLDTKTWLPEDLLIKADKMTMAASIELRVPFLDHKLVEFAAALPAEMKTTAGHSKYIFKKYAEKLLPKTNIYRKKRGFPVPVTKWLREDLNDIMKDILLDSTTRQRGLFDTEYLDEIIRQHVSANQDFSRNIWNLLLLEIWMRIFMDANSNWSLN